MKVIDSIAEILKREGVQFLSIYPTNPIIEPCAALGIRPIVCRQERVGVGIADGLSRTSNGKKTGVFAMQYGPGSENAYPGVATAYSDSTPVLLLPLGHARNRSLVFPQFSSFRNYAFVTKLVEVINLAEQVPDIMRRAFNSLRSGRFGPVMIEIPEDVVSEEIGDLALAYRPVKFTSSPGNPDDIARAAKTLVAAKNPVIVAGQGVLYAEASNELVELAELCQAPVMTTLEGKSAFPEDHQLSLGTGGDVTTGPVVHFLKKADVVLAVGTSLTRHGMAVKIPEGKVIVHITTDTRDINKDYYSEHPLIGDAKLVLRQFIDVIKRLSGEGGRRGENSRKKELENIRLEWLRTWMPGLTSSEVPINPYRVIWEFMQAVDSREAIVTHDSGSPRDQIVPFYPALLPRGYLGWGKSHALGSSLGLIIGAKLAAPEKFCVNFMGDAAFGMTGLDFETAVRCKIPITTIVLNNSTMAIEKGHLVISHELYRTRDISGNYTEIGRALGGHAQRIENPEDIRPAILNAKKANAEGRAALLEFITKEELNFSHPRPFQ